MNEQTELACIECARALAPRFDPLLVERVETQLWGGAAFGEPGHMDALLTDGSAIASVLIGILGLALSHIQIRIARGSGGTPPKIHFHGNITEAEKTFELKIGDLGADEKETAQQVVKEVCAWLRENGAQ